MNYKKPKLLMFFIKRASFIEKDIRILSRQFDVIEFQFNASSKLLLPWVFFKQFTFLLFNLSSFSVCISQFGGYHSFLPGLLGKIFKVPHIIICCGSDCVAYPTLSYGNLRNGLLKWFIGKSYFLANLLCPVHEKLMAYENTYYLEDNKLQGVFNFFPQLNTPVFPVENGYDPEQWKPNGPRKKQFLTVAGYMEDANRAKLKGVDLVEQLARYFPDYEFVLIGASRQTNTSNDPANLKRIPLVPNHEIGKFYQESLFYLQFSISEGFPNSLSEAMASGCVPIVSNVSSMPEIIGDTGFILEIRDINKLVDLVKLALHADLNSLSEKARERIITHYPQSNRELKLFQAISSLVPNL
ncbi:MAG: glycosyltransferase family 4 protein [Bacteroidia bacterium]|nr:glycosyltransferase family 4 protein [Bacteroidia bacterium]